MKKTMVYLPEELHERLPQLAFEHRTSMAELIRRAVQAAYGETNEDIRHAEAELASYLEDPSSGDLTRRLLEPAQHSCIASNQRRRRGL